MSERDENPVTEVPLKKGIPSWLSLLLKVAVSAGCLGYIGQKISWLDTWQLLRHSNPVWLSGAVAFFILSKAVSAVRLNRYFRDIGILLKETEHAALYWLGMFYNLFLPGGIGGDAYKVILLRRRFAGVSVKKMTAAVLLDRISGLAGLAILAVGCFAYIYRDFPLAYVAVLMTIPAIRVFRLIVQRWFPSFAASFFPALWMGLMVQVLQMLCVICIMYSIGLRQHLAEIQGLFLLSSVVAVIPFTMGGLGARELVFLWGARQFLLPVHESVYISLLFYLITVLVAFPGIWWVYRPVLVSKEK